ncbi:MULTISPECIES: hypothetical protein [unclassified Duganella]|uniref:hypothetical protein n=1 Tax=unclassified Duganella TaxID=2636909 RepID=UPI000E34AB2D|nr:MULTISPECIES: hypothetical protein [unclassified Duganella]RFP18749.1 hypothetical protein D0T23_02865 [Duganella sp. BJB475]RFP35414.1 hypothetical protein D0T21_02865 [Duganella sp. BJB476]
MLQKIYDEGSNPEQGAQPQRRREDTERAYTAPFRAAIDFFRLDAERRRPAPAENAVMAEPRIFGTNQSGN